ncbi:MULTISPECIES: GAP family protein [unclassified Streptomyces]|uniref:GAP family protein n=1 Tax=unclassified Streptomyces TaxID=2593676 RepID=UPI002366DB5B|nr:MULTISPECIES: GAP family protein [unclassified Streptomyces]MDF3147857.1 GAP family protein [Streptomyces sp. T21Q-yed]WDF42928.1 GAP family protein [Streptomyces sp. T12]
MVFDLLLIALAIALDPLPLMAFVLVVASAKGIRTGLTFISGWTACLVAVIALVLTLTGGQPPAPRSPPSTVHLVAKLVVGLSLVAYGLHRHWRPVHDRTPSSAKGRHHGSGGADASADVASPPHGTSSSLTSRMERGSIWPAAGLAVLLQPWGLVAAGAVTVVEADTSQVTTWLVLVAFCVLATAGLLTAELYVVLRPASAQHRLLGLRTWMADHAQQAIVLGSIAIGLWLTGRSVYELAG